MRRPTHIKLTPAGDTTYGAWSRRALGIGAILIALLIGYPMLQRAVQGGADVSAAEQSREPACAHWDEAATDALVGLVRGKQDSDLRLVGDAVFRMRRARRNCHTGWIRLACLDYYAVIHGHASRSGNWPLAAGLCAPDGLTTRNAVIRFDRPAP
jgi:hypothetical protein